MYYTLENGMVVEKDRTPPPISANNGYLNYEWVFNTPSLCWTVNHNLGRYPFTLVLTPGGVEMDAEIININENQLQVCFASPQVGRIRCI